MKKEQKKFGAVINRAEARSVDAAESTAGSSGASAGPELPDSLPKRAVFGGGMEA